MVDALVDRACGELLVVARHGLVAADHVGVDGRGDDGGAREAAQLGSGRHMIGVAMRQHDGIELAPAQSRRDLFRIACGVHHEGGGAVRHNVDVGLIRPQNQERRVDTRSLHLICHVVLLHQYLRTSRADDIAPRPCNGNGPHRSAHSPYPTKSTRESGPSPGGFRSRSPRIRSSTEIRHPGNPGVRRSAHLPTVGRNPSLRRPSAPCGGHRTHLQAP